MPATTVIYRGISTLEIIRLKLRSNFEVLFYNIGPRSIPHRKFQTLIFNSCRWQWNLTVSTLWHSKPPSKESFDADFQKRTRTFRRSRDFGPCSTRFRRSIIHQEFSRARKSAGRLSRLPENLISYVLLKNILNRKTVGLMNSFLQVVFKWRLSCTGCCYITVERFKLIEIFRSES
jgi:hypothetical protein